MSSLRHTPRPIVVSALVSLLICFAAPGALGKCQFPPLSPNFTFAAYQGPWYEIGKIQTWGGAFFERECVCTQLDATPNGPGTAANANGTLHTSCRDWKPSGKTISHNGTLKAVDGFPGRFKLSEFWLEPSVTYNVIYMTDKYSIEYDCQDVLGITNYCFHVLSRTPTIPDEAEQYMLTFADKYQLNPENLKYKKTLQQGCYDANESSQ